MNNYIVYGLFDLEMNDSFRYFGITNQSMHRRLNNHFSDARNRDETNRRLTWLRAMINYDKPVGYVIIADNLSQDEAYNLEKYLIKLYRKMGVWLANSTEGGDGSNGFTHDEETKQLIGEYSKKKWMNEDYRKLMTEKFKTPEVQERLSKRHKGRKLSDEHRRKISESMKLARARQ